MGYLFTGPVIPTLLASVSSSLMWKNQRNPRRLVCDNAHLHLAQGVHGVGPCTHPIQDGQTGNRQEFCTPRRGRQDAGVGEIGEKKWALLSCGSI